jgi:predicted pyridoxine 5'-phosphate oxidase superfamily flavin-nucleotide-binding protein
MAKFTEDMINIMENAQIFLISTADKNGVPNSVPVGARIVSDDEIFVVDYLMVKTRKNLEENPHATITAWVGDLHYGYQFKGIARVEESGEYFDKAVEIEKANAANGGLGLVTKAAVIIKIEEVYYLGIKDSSINLFN